jgi:hypothetical protein
MGFTWAPSSAEVYTQVSGTITFNDDDVQWVYVDWDDGEDNSLEYAINQWERLETDSNSITLDHTYTKAGTFNPAVRTINSEGFVSKYFYLAGTTNLPAPRESSANISSITISDGNPTSVMRIENKEVLSGIDNNIFEEGPKDIYIMIPPLLSDAEKAAMQTVSIEITGVMSAVIYNDKLPGGSPASYNDTEYGVEKTIITKSYDIDVPGTSNSSSPASALFPLVGGMFSKILEVRWVNPKYVGVTTKSVINNYNKLKIFLIAQSDDGNWYPITYITNGDPVKITDDVKRNVTLDFSQSRAKASNKSISYYKYDSGKVWFEPNLQWQASSSTQLNDNTKTTDAIVKKGYTYYTQPNGLMGSGSITGKSVTGFKNDNPWSYGSGADSYAMLRDQFPINEFNQLYNQYSFARVEAVSDSTKYSGLDTFKTLYRIHPTSTPSGSDGYYITNPGSSLSANETSIHTSGSWLNGSTNAINTNTWNVGPFFEQDASTARVASEYFMMTNENKFGKVFINNTMYSPEMESNLAYNSGSSIAGVYYLRVTNEIAGNKATQKAEWVPLKFEDTTKIEKEYRNSTDKKYETKSNTMSRSGYIEFDIPDDWYNVTHVSGLTGGFFANTTEVKGTTSDWSIAVNADYGGTAVSSTGRPFSEWILTGATGLSGYTNEQLTGYKYIYQINTAANAADQGKVFWVVSGNVANNKLYLSKGSGLSISTTAGGALTGYLRRINIYEVFDAASKVSDNGNVPNVTGIPAIPYHYNWMFASGTGAGQKMATEVKNNFRGYPLKIVVSGASNHFISGTTQPGWQPWNMFPVAQSDSQIIEQKDNTAYDLSYFEITSDIGVSYASTYYQAISKKGKVFIVRTGTPIQTISFGGTALGDESQFKFNEDYTSYGTLRLLRRMQSEGTRIMWDETQKDGTYVRFFGYPTQVTQSHSVDGPRAPMNFSFTMLVEEICLLDKDGTLMSDVIPLGGIKDAATFK